MTLEYLVMGHKLELLLQYYVEVLTMYKTVTLCWPNYWSKKTNCICHL